MNVQRFFASNSREALKNVKAGLGPDAVILSNNTVEGGVEILALPADDLSLLAQPAVVRTPRARSARAEGAEAAPPASQTLARAASSQVTHAALLSRAIAPETAAPEAPAQPAVRAQAELTMAKNVIHEIKSLRGLVEDQLASLAWGDVARRDPLKSRVMRELLRCGFSAHLARELAEKMPAGDANGASAWVRKALALNLQVVGADNEIVARGGVYAIVGPTGVGKTTTCAKLAARCVMRYGADKVALLTTDGYRVGAHEQLRIYGKILGLTVHAVKDATDLNITLSELRRKHLVLIDTVGMSQRDQRVAEQIAMLASAGPEVKRLLLLPATSSGETLEDVVRAYRQAQTTAQAGSANAAGGKASGAGISGCILSKIDEGVRLGTVLDVAMRHRLPVHYVADGQRVPEDLHLPNAQKLLQRALRPEGDSVFTLQESEVPLVLGARRPLEHGQEFGQGALCV
jgi:flagellar biosynthesis protein FlhF